jgi:hypothetical protein
MRSFAQEHDFLSFPGGNENGVLELREAFSRDTKKECEAEEQRMEAAYQDASTAVFVVRLENAFGGAQREQKQTMRSADARGEL